MCGVTGLIGVPKDERIQKWSYQLAKTLLAATVERGPHATGVYAYYPKLDDPTKNSLFCYKLAAPSPDYVKTKEWKKMQDKWPFLMLGHCRYYTNGTPDDHLNNHPHMSDDNKSALIHNGVISGFAGLRKTYPCKSDCDSEILLRIIESEEDPQEGIRKLYRLMGTGDSFACMYSRWDNVAKVANLWCFKNTGRPLCYIDLREKWGQYHFSSTPEIMEKALKKSGLPKAIQEVPVVEIPDEEIWHTQSDTLEWDIEPIVQPVTAVTGYRNPSQNFERATVPMIPNADKDQVKALIDAIVENCTSIDDNVRLDAVTEYGGLEVLKEKLKKAAFELEKIVNPAIEDDESLVDGEYFD